MTCSIREAYSRQEVCIDEPVVTPSIISKLALERKSGVLEGALRPWIDRENIGINPMQPELTECQGAQLINGFSPKPPAACGYLPNHYAQLCFAVTVIDREQPDVSDVNPGWGRFDREVRTIVAVRQRGEPRFVLGRRNVAGAIHQLHDVGVVCPLACLLQMPTLQRNEPYES
jgi:hypothetical protein